MTEDIYKLVYCSRNLIPGNPTNMAVEIQRILAAARVNNAKSGVTGALLFNAGLFAQVLEGPLPSVERIFEKIQCDSRHSEVTVLQSSPADKREFPAWSMAFSGKASDQDLPLSKFAFDDAFSNNLAAGEEVLALLRNLVVQEDDWG